MRSNNCQLIMLVLCVAGLHISETLASFLLFENLGQGMRASVPFGPLFFSGPNIYQIKNINKIM